PSECAGRGRQKRSRRRQCSGERNLDEIRLLRDLRALLGGEPAFADHVLIVQAYDDPVGLAARFVNLSQIFRHVLFITGRPYVESFAELITIAAVVILDRTGGTDFRRCVKAMIDHTLPLPVEAESGAE